MVDGLGWVEDEKKEGVGGRGGVKDRGGKSRGGRIGGGTRGVQEGYKRG